MGRHFTALPSLSLSLPCIFVSHAHFYFTHFGRPSYAHACTLFIFISHLCLITLSSSPLAFYTLAYICLHLTSSFFYCHFHSLISVFSFPLLAPRDSSPLSSLSASLSSGGSGSALLRTRTLYPELTPEGRKEKEEGRRRTESHTPLCLIVASHCLQRLHTHIVTACRPSLYTCISLTLHTSHALFAASLSLICRAHTFLFYLFASARYLLIFVFATSCLSLCLLPFVSHASSFAAHTYLCTFASLPLSS